MLDRVTIRGIDPDVYAEARQIVEDNPGLTTGAFITAALQDYIDALPFDDEDDSEGPG